MSSFENFVQCRIQTPLTASATDLALYAADAPYNLPPETGGLVVLCDSPGNPSKIEVIRYSHRSGLALYGLVRGQEGTAALSWTGPAYCYQGLMAGDFQALLGTKVDKATGQSLMLDAERTKLAGIAAGAQVNTVNSVAGRTGAVVLAKADVGLGNVDNTSDSAKPVSTAQQTALNLKANLASPALTGTPTAPTPTAGTNTTQIANTAFVQAALAALVNGAPGALDQLSELAAAMGNDPNFATTMLNALALKAPLASPALTGNPTAPTPAADDNDTSIATTAHVKAAMALFGVGSVAPLLTVSDLNSLVAVGRWLDGGAPELLNRPAGFSYGEIVVAGFITGYETQTYTTTTGRSAFRSRENGVWGAWRELYHTGNILGTVSQSGGVPTGAIIERGSNANGEYVRFADGTQECWGSGTGSPNASDANAFGTTSGTMFYENVQVTLPAAFINTSYALHSAATARGVASLGSSTTTSTAFVQCRHAGQGVSVPFRYTAKGRWF